jgi:hypothetical protein
MSSDKMTIFHSSPPFFPFLYTLSLANKEKVITEISCGKYGSTLRAADRSISYSFPISAKKLMKGSEHMPSSFFIPEMEPQATLPDRFPSSFFHMLEKDISRPSIPS